MMADGLADRSVLAAAGDGVISRLSESTRIVISTISFAPRCEKHGPTPR